MSRSHMRPTWYVSRQQYWPDGVLAVEISHGLDHAGPDMLTDKYKRLGEGREFLDPREAAEAAIEVQRQWAKDAGKRISLSFGDADIGWDAQTQKELLVWANKAYEGVEKCDHCGEILGKEWYTDPYGEGKYCREYCAEQEMLEAQVELDDEAQPNPRGSFVKESDGRIRPVKNLGWLLRHWGAVEWFEVDKPPQVPKFHHMIDAYLVARMREGQLYATPFASQEVLRHFLDRPVFRGLHVRWFGRDEVIGSPAWRAA